jgi:hypothetical protein
LKKFILIIYAIGLFDQMLNEDEDDPMLEVFSDGAFVGKDDDVFVACAFGRLEPRLIAVRVFEVSPGMLDPDNFSKALFLKAWSGCGR